MDLARIRQHALEIFQAGLAAADPAGAVALHIDIQQERYRRIFVIGAGKAGASMARAVEDCLGSRIAGGLINVKDGHTADLRYVELNECGHPIPDQRGVDGARRIAEIVRQAGAGDLVLCLISGGASALMPLPAPGITLEDKQETTRQLLACGATIHEINAVRKHLSAIKGGQLALMAQPAHVIALLLSDVIGDDLSVIGSGPTAPDESTFAGALAVLDRYGLRAGVPAQVRERLEAGQRGDVPETPKQLQNVSNVIAGSNRLAIDAAERHAAQLGYRTLVLSTTIQGETRDIAQMHAAIACEIVSSGRPVPPPACILSGGETTVTLRGKGSGGRNQEFALAAVPPLAGCAPAILLSAGTDGTDGPTDAAGAIADSTTAARAAALELDPAQFLADNDSYHFFERLGDLVITGPTGTNVMDLHIVLVPAPDDGSPVPVRQSG